MLAEIRLTQNIKELLYLHTKKSELVV